MLRVLARHATRRALAAACACAGGRWTVGVSRDLGAVSFRAQMTSGS